MVGDFGKSELQSTALKTSGSTTNYSSWTLCFMFRFTPPWKRYITSLILTSHRRKKARRDVRLKLFQLHGLSATILSELATDFQLVNDVSKNWESRFQVVSPNFLPAVWTRVFCVQPSWNARRTENMAARRFNRILQNTSTDGTYKLWINIRKPFQIDSHGYGLNCNKNCAVKCLDLLQPEKQINTTSSRSKFSVFRRFPGNAGNRGVLAPSLPATHVSEVRVFGRWRTSELPTILSSPFRLHAILGYFREIYYSCVVCKLSK